MAEPSEVVFEGVDEQWTARPKELRAKYDGSRRRGGAARGGGRAAYISGNPKNPGQDRPSREPLVKASLPHVTRARLCLLGRAKRRNREQNNRQPNRSDENSVASMIVGRAMRE